MEQGIAYPPPLPSPVFKLTSEDWADLEGRSSTHIAVTPEVHPAETGARS